MLHFYSTVGRFFFIFWVRISQLLGLILVNFDEKKDRFVHWKFSSVYCVIFGVVASMSLPLAIIRFQTEMSSNVALSFIVLISTSLEYLFYFYMVLSYVLQFKLRHQIRDCLNNFLRFVRTFVFKLMTIVFLLY